MPLYVGQEVTFQCAATITGNAVISVEWTEANDANGTSILNTFTHTVESSIIAYITASGTAPEIRPLKCTVTVSTASTAADVDQTIIRPIRYFTCYSMQKPVKGRPVSRVAP